MAVRKRKSKTSKSDKAQPASARVITGKARSSYMRVLKLEEDDNGNKICSTSIFIPKKDKKTVRAIKDAINAAARKKLGSDVDIFKSKKLRNPLHDGDELIEDPESSIGKEAKGCYVMTAKAYKIPQVVNRQNERITDFDELEEICVSGFYFYFSLTLKGFDVETPQGRARGVRCLLNNLMFIGEGERLDGGKSAEDDFADFAIDDDDDDDDDDGYDDD